MWPLQKDADEFYGNPRGVNGRASAAWEAANLTTVCAPYQLYYDGTPIHGVRVHKKCAASLRRVFERIWDAAGHEQAVVDSWGASKFAGAYNFRNKRNGSTLSMHAYACAIDLDPARNAFHSTRPNFGKPGPDAVVKAFEAEGWIWGGRWHGRSCDGQHFQAARVNNVTAPQLLAAGSRTIAATNTIKTNARGLTGAFALASATASQVNDAHDQIVGIMSAVDNGKSVVDILKEHWQIGLIIMASAVIAYNLWRIWHSAEAAEAARVDDAREGTPGDQVLLDNPIPGSNLDGVVFYDEASRHEAEQ